MAIAFQSVIEAASKDEKVAVSWDGIHDVCMIRMEIQLKIKKYDIFERKI